MTKLFIPNKPVILVILATICAWAYYVGSLILLTLGLGRTSLDHGGRKVQ